MSETKWIVTFESVDDPSEVLEFEVEAATDRHAVRAASFAAAKLRGNRALVEKSVLLA